MRIAPFAKLQTSEVVNALVTTGEKAWNIMFSCTDPGIEFAPILSVIVPKKGTESNEVMDRDIRFE